jgi:hypothetical protein
VMYLRKFSLFLQMKEEFTAVDVIHDHVKFVFCLKGVIQLHNERMRNLLKNILFIFGMCH